MEYRLIRSSRRSVALEVTPDLSVIVRAPRKMPKKDIDAFVRKNQDWLKGALKRTEERKLRQDEIEARKEALKREAQRYLPERTALWAEKMGVSPARIRITSATTRFGSCSGKNRICYSWRLMAYPKEGVDYVIVHELAHIIQKNHSAAFYALVERYLPDWRQRRNLLKK